MDVERGDGKEKRSAETPLTTAWDVGQRLRFCRGWTGKVRLQPSSRRAATGAAADNWRGSGARSRVRAPVKINLQRARLTVINTFVCVCTGP